MLYAWHCLSNAIYSLLISSSSFLQLYAFHDLALLSLIIIMRVSRLQALVKVIELVYVSMALMMFVPRHVQSYIFYNRCIHLVVFVFLCFTSLWIFHLIWVSIVEDDSVLISVQRGLTGTRIRPSSRGSAAARDKAQSFALSLGTNLLANQSEPSIHSVRPDVTSQGGRAKQTFVKPGDIARVGLSAGSVGGSCLMLKCCHLDTRRGQDADKLFVVWKMVIIVQSCASPKWPLWKTPPPHSTLRLREAFLTEERITSGGDEHEWTPNVRESWELELIYAKQVNFPLVLHVEMQKRS